MSVAVLNAEVPALLHGSDRAKQRKQLDETFDTILSQAREVSDNREHYGEAGARDIFDACEANLRVQIKVAAEQKAMFDALAVLKDRVSDDASPADVEKAFRDAVKEHVQAVDGEALMRTSKHARQLRTLIDGAGGGAGPSGAADVEVATSGSFN